MNNINCINNEYYNINKNEEIDTNVPYLKFPCNKEYTLINPVITWKRSGANGIKPFKEGCLSAPGVYTIVNRPQKVVCEYLDENGEAQRLDQGGWLSAIIQHELDHLEGFCEVFNAVDEQN